MRIAVLVKQIPQFEAMALGADGRLVRDGLELEMNAYCRRAVRQAVELVREHGGDVVVFTLGPPSADDVLREAIAWGDEHGSRRQIRGVHVTRPRVRRQRHARDRAGARAPRSTHEGRVRPRARAAATRSTPTPARSAPSSPSCSTCRSSPAARHLAVDGDTRRSRALRARRRLARSCAPRCPRCCAARSG